MKDTKIMAESLAENNLQRHIVFLGNSGVGKTALATSLIGQEYKLLQPGMHGINKLSFDKIKNVVFIDLSVKKTNKRVISTRFEELNPIVAIISVFPRVVNLYPEIQHWDSLLPKTKGRNILKFLVLTKLDQAVAHQDFPLDDKPFHQFGFQGIYRTSAKLGFGIQELRAAIINAYKTEYQDDDKNDIEVVAVLRVMSETLCELISRNTNALNSIEWRDLERIIAVALGGIGFDVQLTPSTKDGGKDVVANCIVKNVKKKFYVEVKHWRNGNRPGPRQISEFVEINARDHTDGGLFISSSGFTDTTYARLSKLLRQKVRLAGKPKIVSLCQHYVRKKYGIWHCITPLPELLFEDTICCQT